MKIKDMCIINAFFFFFAFIYGLLKGTGVLTALLIPQAIAFLPCFFCMRLARVMEACGAKKVSDVTIKPMLGVLVILVSAFALWFVYNSVFHFSTDGFFETGVLVSVFTSNVMGLSVAVLLAVIVCYVI